MRTLLIPFVVVALLFMFGAASQVYSTEEPILQDFDINACYASCGCHQGLFQACFDCKQQCERKYWKDFDRETGGKNQKSDAED
jgi:hypothetical protein